MFAFLLGGGEILLILGIFALPLAILAFVFWIGTSAEEFNIAPRSANIFWRTSSDGINQARICDTGHKGRSGRSTLIVCSRSSPKS